MLLMIFTPGPANGLPTSTVEPVSVMNRPNAFGTCSTPTNSVMTGSLSVSTAPVKKYTCKELLKWVGHRHQS